MSDLKIVLKRLALPMKGEGWFWISALYGFLLGFIVGMVTIAMMFKS